MTTEYPFDASALQKGDTVSVATLEHAYSVRRGTDAYRLALLRGRDYLARYFASRGEVVTVVSQDFSLRILTDEEQASYNPEQFKSGIRKAGRAHRRMLGADRSKIHDPGLLDQHDRSIEVQGRQLSAVHRESKQVVPGPTARLTPGRRARGR